MITPINKTLAQIKPSDDTLTLLYRVPANVHHTSISGINICNQDNANNSFCVTLAVNGASFSANQYLYFHSPLAKYGTQLAFVGATLQPNDAIYVQSVPNNLGAQLLDADGGTTATVTANNGSSNVVGSNTVFTSITAGATVRINGINKVINQIQSDTQMNLTSAWSTANVTGVYAYLPGYSNIVYNINGIQYIQPPTITNLSITSGDVAGGNTVTITGNNFFNASAVKFGSKYASYTPVNNTTITAITPAGTVSTINVTVDADGGLTKVSANSQFTYTNISATTGPSIESLSSNTSLLIGGQSITITGNNFVDVIGVKFGEFYSYTVINASNTEIVAAVPPAFQSGTVDVAVVSNSGTSQNNANTKFSYTDEV